MKIFFIFFLYFQFFLICSKHSKESFLKAASLYESGNYYEALRLLSEMPDQTPVVLYNQGILFLELKEYSKALCFFRKVQFRSNFALVKKSESYIIQIQKILNFSQDSFLKQCLLYLHSFFSTLFLQIMTLILGILFWIFYFFKKNMILIQKMNGFLFLIFLILSLITLSMRFQKIALVINGPINIYVGPNKDFHKVGQVEEASEVKVVQEYEKWYKIKHKKIEGWAEKINFLSV